MRKPSEAEILAAAKVRRACEEAGVLDALAMVDAYTTEQIAEAFNAGKALHFPLVPVPSVLEQAFTEKPAADITNAALLKLGSQAPHDPRHDPHRPNDRDEPDNGGADRR